MRLRRTQQAAAAATAVVAASLGVALPGAGAAGSPCFMSVSSTPVAHRVYSTGVVFDEFKVKVTSGSGSQTATVQRMVMPTGSKPKLVYKRIGVLDELRDQVKAQAPRAVAAVNGDFFFEYRWYTGGSTIMALGPSVSHGTVLRAEANPHPVVGVDSAGNPYADKLRVSGSVTTRSGTYPITGVNWHTISDKGVVEFTRAWQGGTSFRRPVGAVEWVVKNNGTIADVRTGSTRGLAVARNTRVLAFGRSLALQASRARVGDTAKLVVTQTTSTGVPLTEAVGRGYREVEAAAVVVDCRAVPNDPRPRTTVGWERGHWATLTVPGTGYDSYGYRIGGLGITQTANVARALGFRAAYSVDGGGSVTEYARRNDGAWSRLDDLNSRWQRPIVNGLAFTAP
ncbi:MAG: phosphodiester glycosidase family protein [Actinomycetes bacterium]